jgi:alkylated DNA repair dioxygenase AlkB
MQATLFKKSPLNILPYDGNAVYENSFLSVQEADEHFHFFLNNMPWKNDLVKLFGKTIVTERKMAWFSDDLKPYTYSGKAHKSLPFNEALHILRQKIEMKTGATFNACLLNLYQNGTQAMGWHQDNEPEIREQSSIVSLSLGAARPFQFRHIKSGETVKLILNHGSILNMFGATQSFWKHQLPKALKVKEIRINLTFRNMK